MKRTKSKVAPSSSSTRNIATQTADFDSFTEIAKLQEQLRQLQLQNDVLKQQTRTPKKSEVTAHFKQLYTSETPKSNIEKHSCKCKKNCSSQACGCVKKNNKCDSSCKCDDKICQNQKLKHDNNKENVNNTALEIFMNQSTKKNESIEVKFDPMKPKHQLSRTPPNKKFGEISNKTESMMDNNKSLEPMMDNNKSLEPMMDNNKLLEPMMDNNKSLEPMMDNNKSLEPMMDNNKSLEPMMDNNKSLAMDNVTETQSHHKPNKDTKIVSSVQDVKEEHVDWQEHTAQLIPCKKCKRTFMPHRIQKHEACCKKI